MPESTTITTLIVDDEPLGRDLVRHMLATHLDFRVLAECGDGEKALAAIKRHAPQLVFLDIKMPRLDGMALVERLEPEARPLIIFITAHDSYAIKAFAEHAFDYLLKPFDQERFDQTIARVRQHVRQIEEAKLGQSVRSLLGGSTAIHEASKPALERIVVRESGRVYFVEVAEIEWLEAEGNYVAMHVAGGKTPLVHETLTSLAGRLDAAVFVRIHRSTIVRVDRIKELLPHFNGEFVVVLKDGTRLKLSRSYLDTARQALGLR
jgi:two-component system LytT family response regulator